MHELVRHGMLVVLKGERIPTKAFESFSVNLRIVLSAAKQITGGQQWEMVQVFDEEIIRQHSTLSFQHPEKVANALSLIWVEEHKWQVIAAKIAIDQSEVRAKLNKITTRRNCLVCS
jgi:hypothetical protein